MPAPVPLPVPVPVPALPLVGGNGGITGTGRLPVCPVAVGLGGTRIGTVGIAANGSLRPTFLRIWLTRASGGKVWIKPATAVDFAGCPAIKGVEKGVASVIGVRLTTGGVGVL